MANNGAGVRAVSTSQTQPVLVVVDTCTIAHNTTGTEAATAAAGSATIRVTNSTIYHNVYGIVPNGGYGDRVVRQQSGAGNTNFSGFSGTVALQ